MDRLSLRAWLAVVLAGSALLFFAGIYLERSVVTPAVPAAVAPSNQPRASHAEGEAGESGEAGEAGEAGHSEAPVAPTGEAGETAEQHAAEARPFGIDLESPFLVGAAIVISLLLGVAVIRTTTPLVPLVIVLFAAVFAAFDLIEVSYQLGASRAGLAVIAALLIALHVVAGLIALALLSRRRMATS